ncbi:MAG: hypothetical protein ACI9XB_000689 [Gammaproteobacteria bacterium]|jgi:hypothetical protein
MKIIGIILIVLVSSVVNGQNQEKRVLFLGNSYTSVNNLPQMISNIATSMGDTLVWDVEAPGGYYLYDHSISSTSINKIESGNWDYVVLQDQSQAMSLPDFQMSLGISSIQLLDSIINEYNSCAETMFYMTWGRKNGDSLYYQVYSPWYEEPSYEFMDSLIHDRYMQMSVLNNAEVSPVGAVWKYVRENHSGIELYQSDESHPSIAGSYLAACCFYTALFRKDPTLISFNSSLSISEATNIQDAVKLVVYDSLLNWNIGIYDSLNNVACAMANVDIIDEGQNSLEQIFPNPATSILTVNFDSGNEEEQIQIYNGSGILIRELEAPPTSEIDIKEFANGVYFIRLKNHPSKTLKFIKN